MGHLRTLKYLNLFLSALLGAGSLFGAVFIVAGLSQGWDDPKGALVFVLYGLVAFLLFAIFAAAHVYAGFMVTAGRGRGAQTMLALLHMANVPLGTAYALYAFWVMYVNDETVRIFATPGGRRVR
jgi:hypothetical protein